MRSNPKKLNPKFCAAFLILLPLALHAQDAGAAPPAGEDSAWVKIIAALAAIMIAARAIVKLTPTPKDDTLLQKVVEFLKHVGLHIGCVAFAVVLLAGCGTLDQAGVYNGDKALYSSELTITTSYDLLHTFVQWEHDNAAALKQFPQIHAAAENVRANAKHWIASANALHDAYVAAPTTENGAALQKALDVLRAALNEAAAYMAAAANAPPQQAPPLPPMPGQ